MDSILSPLIAFPPHPPPNPPLTDVEYDKQARKFVDSLAKLNPQDLRSDKKGEDLLNVSTSTIFYRHQRIDHRHPAPQSGNKYARVPPRFAGSHCCLLSEDKIIYYIRCLCTGSISMAKGVGVCGCFRPYPDKIRRE